MEYGSKLNEERLRLDVRNTFFIQSVVTHWNKLHREVKGCPISGGIQRSLGSLIQRLATLPLAGGVGLLSNLSYSMILYKWYEWHLLECSENHFQSGISWHFNLFKGWGFICAFF